jgi:hypothetical protein
MKAFQRDPQHLSFQCPGCQQEHQVTVNGLGHSWGWNASLERPTLTPSVLMRTGHYVPGHQSGDHCWCSYWNEHPDKKRVFECTVCHSFVNEGRIQFLSDCTHALAGQTMELPDVQ